MQDQNICMPSCNKYGRNKTLKEQWKWGKKCERQSGIDFFFFFFKSYSMYKTSALLEDRRYSDWSYAQREITKSRRHNWQERLEPKCLRQVRCYRAKEMGERHDKTSERVTASFAAGLGDTRKEAASLPLYYDILIFSMFVWFGRERKQVFNN